MKLARALIVSISAAAGTCFAVVAGLSISAIVAPARRFHALSVVLAGVAIYLGYLAFRAAISGQTDEETLVTSLLHGVVGAFVGLLVGFAALALYRPGIQGFLAHAMGKPASSFSTFRFVAASLILGFGAGFVSRVPKSTA